MISDMLKIPELPDNLRDLSEELEKLLRLVNNATLPVHLDTAEKYLANFCKKWSLTNPKNPNPITFAIQEKLTLKRNAWVIEDIQHAERIIGSRVKEPA